MGTPSISPAAAQTHQSMIKGKPRQGWERELEGVWFGHPLDESDFKINTFSFPGRVLSPGLSRASPLMSKTVTFAPRGLF